VVQKLTIITFVKILCANDQSEENFLQLFLNLKIQYEKFFNF